MVHVTFTSSICSGSGLPTVRLPALIASGVENGAPSARSSIFPPRNWNLPRQVSIFPCQNDDPLGRFPVSPRENVARPRQVSVCPRKNPAPTYRFFIFPLQNDFPSAQGPIFPSRAVHRLRLTQGREEDWGQFFGVSLSRRHLWIPTLRLSSLGLGGLRNTREDGGDLLLPKDMGDESVFHERGRDEAQQIASADRYAGRTHEE